MWSKNYGEKAFGAMQLFVDPERRRETQPS
jgi:hypothetical protein